MAGLLPNIYATVFITMFSAFAALILRLKARRVTKIHLWYDDYLAVVAFVFATGYCIAVLTWAAHYRLGQTIEPFDTDRIEEILEKSKRLLFAIELCYTLSVGASKLAILLFYWRIFQFTGIRIPIQVLVVTSTAWIIVRIFMVIFHCLPVQAYWDMTVKDAHCAFDPWRLSFGTVLTHLSMDVIILLLPVIQVAKLRLPIMQKLAVVGLFTSGTVVCIASVFVLVEVIRFDLNTTEMPHDIAMSIIWAAVEVNMAIFAACLPMLRPIFRQVFPGLASGTNSGPINRPNDSIKLFRLKKPPAREADETSSTRQLADEENGMTSLPGYEGDITERSNSDPQSIIFSGEQDSRQTRDRTMGDFHVRKNMITQVGQAGHAS